MTFKQLLKQRARKSTSVKVIDRVGPYGVILSPVLTEKAYKSQEEANKYVFKVHPDANKNDVIAAVKYLYKVTPLKVNIMNTAFKGRERRKLVKRSYKKAVVTLTDKEKIEFAV